MSSDGSEEEANIFSLAGQLNGFDWGNDHEVKFHQIKSRFLQEIKRTIMKSKVIFFRRSKFDLLITAFFMRSKVKNNAF
jgi:hypothetical protein